MYDAEGWIDSAEQADDTLKGVWCALIAIAKSQERIAQSLHLRDQLAAAALIELSAAESPEHSAEVAYRYADAMLAARVKKAENAE